MYKVPGPCFDPAVAVAVADRGPQQSRAPRLRRDHWHVAALAHVLRTAAPCTAHPGGAAWASLGAESAEQALKVVVVVVVHELPHWHAGG